MGTLVNEAEPVIDLHWETALTLGHCVSALETFKPILARALSPGVVVHCSLASWKQVDTSALTVLLALRRQANASQASIRFLNSPPTLQSLARMSQVDTLLALG